MPLGLGVGSAADALTSLTRASHWVFAADTDSTYAEFGARGAKIVEET